MHSSNACDKGGKGADNGDKAGQNNGFSTMLIKKLFGFINMFLLNGNFGIFNHRFSKKMTNPVVNGIAQNSGQ